MMNGTMETGRLETPFMAGFRAGMSSGAVIGRKLSSMYKVPSDRPDRMESLLEAIDRSATRGR